MLIVTSTIENAYVGLEGKMSLNNVPSLCITSMVEIGSQVSQLCDEEDRKTMADY